MVRKTGPPTSRAAVAASSWESTQRQRDAPGSSRQDGRASRSSGTPAVRAGPGGVRRDGGREGVGGVDHHVVLRRRRRAGRPRPPKPPIRTSPTGSRGRCTRPASEVDDLDTGSRPAPRPARGPRRCRPAAGPSRQPAPHHGQRRGHRRTPASSRASTSRCSSTASASASMRAWRCSANLARAGSSDDMPVSRGDLGQPRPRAGRHPPGCRATWCRRPHRSGRRPGTAPRRPPSTRPWWIS